jgi:hypothetical protein
MGVVMLMMIAEVSLYAALFCFVFPPFFIFFSLILKLTPFKRSLSI